MVIIKTKEQIDGIRKSCQLLARVMKELGGFVKPGISTKELNDVAERLIAEGGGKPAFKGYQSAAGVGAFPSALCTSVNDVVVHGPATSDTPLKEGDLIGIDCGIELDGYFSDMALTYPVGKVSEESSKLMEVAKEALYSGIKQMQPGNRVQDISQAIQDVVEPHGFGIIRNFAGHGVGLDVHEDPWIPNSVDKQMKDSLAIEMKPGMIFALEPMISTGKGHVNVQDDGWSVQTDDNSLTAHFEHTVLVTEDGHEILTL